MAPTRLLNPARKPTPASNRRTKPITRPLRPHMPSKPPTASTTRLWASQALQSAFSSNSDPLFRASSPNNNPHPRPHIPFRPLWRGFLAFQGVEPCWTPPAPIRRPCGPPQAEVHGAPPAHHPHPKGKKKAGPPRPRSNHQPQSPPTGR